MRVRVVKASKPSYWYANNVGKEYEVSPSVDGENYKINNDHIRVLDVNDCITISPTIELTLIAPGSRGKVGEISILITQVHIESHQVEYTIAWWDDGQRYSERVPEYEITEAEKTMKVGFQ